MRTPNVTNYRHDPVYPRVAEAVEEVLRRGRIVAPVDVILCLGQLSDENLAEWRRGRVSYLERVISCYLTRLGRLLRIL